MERWTLSGILAFLLLLSLLLPSLLIMFIPSTFRRPVLSWKVQSLPKTSLMVSNALLRPPNCSPLLFSFVPETKTLLVMPKQTSVNNYALKELCNEKINSPLRR
ncbi:gpE [Enterobacteria phage NC6]|uniref:GPE n=2 Tax=Gequatrovirus TaxID=1910952 RepID=Q2LM46_9VIRU|nr:gpE [Escherichia phage ID52]AAZ49034.1 gpE [Escherichia phage ID52]AAZ49363.1 gpE [Enterobacteria phage NC6]